MKRIFTLLGFTSLVIGIIGAFLPILPTTPFVLLAAWLFARGSEKFHRKLLEHKIFGKLIRDFEQDKSIPLHAKIISVSMLWCSILYTVMFLVTKILWVRIILISIAIVVTIHILRYKTRK